MGSYYQIAQDLLRRIRGIVIRALIPLAGTGGNDKGAGGHDIGFEPAKVTLDGDADVTAAGKAGDLIAGISAGEPRLVGDASTGAAIGSLIGYAAELLDRPDGDHIFGRPRREDAVGVASRSAVVGPIILDIDITAVARRKH